MAGDELVNSLLEMIRILNKGIAMERHARDFYAGAARRTESVAGKKMFEWLAAFEVGHKTRLEAKREELLRHPELRGVDIPALGDFDVSEAYTGKDISPGVSDTEVLKIALENEKRAYSFFQKKLTFADDPQLEEMFRQMAGEEEKHMKIIEEQIKHLRLNHIWADLEDLE